jgi:phosphoserine phosphatase RsbU/P
MAGVELLKNIESEKNLVDVLYLSSLDKMPPEIEQLLTQKKLSYQILSPSRFSEMRSGLDFIGTAIIDAKNIKDTRQIIQITESLEMKNIGVILLSEDANRIEHSIDDLFCTLNCRHYTPAELEAKISLNLALRRSNNQKSKQNKSRNFARNSEPKQILPELAETANPKSQHVQAIYRNKLAEKLNMTKSLADNLTEQLRLAGLVQQDFLPAKLPNTDQLRWAVTFLPAEWVSGDIYDIARLDEDHIGFYIADVVGHGMPAALLTIFLKQAMVMRETNGSSYRIFSPSDVMKNLNMKMSAQKLSGYQFATCCYCLLNTKTLTLTYARAGHPYPILLRKGKNPEQLEVRGSLLGIFEQAEFPQQTIQLQPGDKIVLYSDGVDSYIGSYKNITGFSYKREFLEISQMSIPDMLEGFNGLIQTKDIKESEIDDITIVGLEIL